MDHTYAVIMAGGGGTRLWPISRRKNPKHFLSLLGERTLFQATLDRLVGLIPLERTLVVTTADQLGELKLQAPDLPPENILIEPQPRGTAPVIGWAATRLIKRDPQAVMLVLPSDHFMRNLGLFHQLMRTAVKVAQANYLVTLGIAPTFPATGYGYIQQGEAMPGKFDLPAYKVLRFTEKPDEKRARKMIASGDNTWNSGMFIWQAAQILKEFGRQMPELKAAIERIETIRGKAEHESVLVSEWLKLKPETIDYGIMENSRNVAVLPAASLEWSDVGSWDSLFDVLVSDKNGNVSVNCEYMPMDTKNSLIYSSGKKLVVTIGMEEIIVVDAGDALLVCRRDQAQQVRQVIENLKKSNKEEYL